MKEELISLQNENDSEIISDIFERLVLYAKSHRVEISNVEHKDTNKKNEMLVGIFIGLSVNALYDLIKLASASIVKRCKDYKVEKKHVLNEEININGTSYKLSEIIYREKQ